MSYFSNKLGFLKLLSDIWNIDVPKLFQSLFYRKVLIDNNNINFGTKEQKKIVFFIRKFLQLYTTYKLLTDKHFKIIGAQCFYGISL